jgi:diguanylate cyclase (GGDEF)-like protein/PAS domain S-box-containing protein
VCDLHRDNRYDLNLLDLLMPEMDGFQVMEALKRIETDNYLSVLVITAQPSHKLRAMQAGARDFISKPFEISEVLTRIHYMLEVQLLNNKVAAHRMCLEEMVRERTVALRTSEEMFRELAANIPEALWIKNTEQQTIQYVNPAWQKLNGSSAVAGDPVERAYQAIHPEDLQWISRERRGPSSTLPSNEYRLVRSDQSVRWVRARTFSIANPSGKVPWVVESIEDVTLRRETQQQLVHLANHDALTGLPNRALLYEALRDALLYAEENQLTVSVLLLDIDHFKNVNDSFGYTIGDAMLRAFAARLANCVRPGDTVGRLSGNEFAVIIGARRNVQDAVEVADGIRTILQSPVEFEDQTILVTASMGIASFPADTSDLETLIRYAGTAMYDAKASGGNASRCFTPELNSRALAKTSIEDALRLALGRDEFVLHYQPKMDISSGKWTGVEALIQWNRPGHGIVPPRLFAPALENLGLIVPVGAWVIDMACRQIRKWEQSGLGRIPIAVKVSARQMCGQRFVAQVAESVREHGIDPALLEFEITEGTLMAHGEPTDLALRGLKDLGISISIDGFGTGYSSLAYLRRFPVDVLKIDIAIFRDVTTNADDDAIAVAIINMAHSLRLKIIVEGVETRDQLEFLRIHGCDEVQGNLLSKPMPAGEFAARFRNAVAVDADQLCAPTAFNGAPPLFLD